MSVVAGLLAIAWGGLARIGEVLSVKRPDLVLPKDFDKPLDLLRLQSKKNPRLVLAFARQQPFQIDQPDLLAVIRLAFGSLQAGCSLWPTSAGAFRTCFAELLAACKLDQTDALGVKRLDLGIYVRAGGATWLSRVSEDGELARRRGRWLNHKVMGFDIQEVSVVLLLRLPRATKDVLPNLVDSFGPLLATCYKHRRRQLGLSQAHWLLYTLSGQLL